MHGSNSRDDTQENKKLDSSNWAGNYSDYLYSYAALKLYEDELANLAQEAEMISLTAVFKYKTACIYLSRSSGLRSNAQQTVKELEGFLCPLTAALNSGQNPAVFR